MKARITVLLKDKDYGIMVLASLLISLTLCVFAPLELYFSNAGEFWFDITSLLGSITVAFFVVFFSLISVGALLKGKARNVFTGMVFGIGLALYLQANFLNGNIGQLDGRDVDWWTDKSKLAFNCIVWLLCFFISSVGSISFKKIWSSLIMLLSLMLSGMQLAALIALIIAAPVKDGEVHLKTDDMFTLSNKENIIVFVLDTFDAQYFEKYVKEKPEYKELFQGFTYFDNAVAGGASTIYGMPLLLTGKYYDGKDYDEYLKSSYLETNLYKKLDKKNWDNRMLILDSFISDDFFMKYIDNATLANMEISSKSGLLLKLYQLVGYKYLPNILKNQLYFYSGEFDQFRLATGADGAETSVYSHDDEKFIKEFRQEGINLIKDKNAFRLYYLFGAHGPYTLNENGETDSQGTTIEQQIEGLFRMLKEYFGQMREKNIYDNSTIILTGDHGAFDIYQNPCILVKPKQEHQNALKISHAPVTFANILPTLSEAIDGKNDELEKTLFEVKEDEDKIRYQVVAPALVKQFYGGGDWTIPVIFSIAGDARDTKGLTQLGVIDTTEDTKPYRIGDEISFAKGGTGYQYLIDGFSQAEDGGTWTNATKALQKLQFKKKPKKNVRVDIRLQNVFAGKQHVTIYFNDVCVYSQFQADNDISFVVPNNLFVEGEQQLRYRLTTTKPSEVSESTDQRKLSIMLNKMIMKETNEAATVVIPETQYVLGDEIVFTEYENGGRFFVEGVDKIEKDYIWSLGNQAQMEMTIEDCKRDLKAEIQFKAIYAAPQKLIVCHNKNSSDKNEVLFGDQPINLVQTTEESDIIYEHVISSSEESVTFTIPQEYIIDDKLNLVLKFPNAVSPLSQNDSNDSRKRAFAFSSIRIK